MGRKIEALVVPRSPLEDSGVEKLARKPSPLAVPEQSEGGQTPTLVTEAFSDRHSWEENAGLVQTGPLGYPAL